MDEYSQSNDEYYDNNEPVSYYPNDAENISQRVFEYGKE